MFESLNCEDCGGKGVDVGSLHEPEPCQACLGTGRQLVELDTRSSLYSMRKPVGRALPQPVTQLAERALRLGGVE